jgi:ParB family chromosome partitioning protein
LPTGLQMRHDAHYVDELAQHRPTPVGRLINIDRIDPNPEQPRVDIGDLADLTASIKEKGVLEPLLVKPSAISGRWMIIAGERRWRAAREAELRDVPCIEMDVDERAVAEIALIENMQRKDLTAWEEADGLRYLCERFGYTHEDVAHKVGKSRSSVTEALSISTIPESIRERCRRADINSKSLILQIVRQPDEPAMLKMAEEIAQQGMTRDDARAARRAAANLSPAMIQKAPPFTYRYVSPEKDFRLEVRFKKTRIANEGLIAALRKVIEKLEGAE